VCLALSQQKIVTFDLKCLMSEMSYFTDDMEKDNNNNNNNKDFIVSLDKSVNTLHRTLTDKQQ